MYYVYKYLRQDGTPYYVGKGKGDRAWYKGKHERINLPEDKERIVIVEENLTEEQAFNLERELIKKYGRKDLGTGILRNLTEGGEGAAGFRPGRPPQERIDRIAASNRGQPRSAETKEKQSKIKIGTKQSEEHKQNKANKIKGIKRSEELKKQWSESKKGTKNPMYGKESSRKGKSLEEIYGIEKAKELQEKARINSTGKKDSKDTRKNKSEAQKKSWIKRKLKIGENHEKLQISNGQDH
jgi:hypothetical protein